MAVRSVRAFLHNDTNFPLVKISDECPHGEWTRRAPDRIEAHSVAMMRAASTGLGSVESRATYQIGDNTAATVYIHWNNPISGSNSYHTDTGAANYAFWAAQTSGSDPVAHFVLRPAGSVDTDFLPSRDGFHFDNKWPNTPYSLPPLRGSLLDKKYGNASSGLCGGMVLGALDYFVAGQEMLPDTTAPAGERDKLFLYLVNRIFDTFSLDSVSLLLKLMDPAYPDSDENVLSTFGFANGRAAVMAHQEWPLLRADIDAGKPSPVCIVTVKSLNPGALGKCHQLLAYAYDAAGHDVTLHMYDPNKPDKDDVYMKFNDGDVSHRIVVEHNIGIDGRPVYCFVRMNGKPKHIPKPTRPRLTRVERQARRIQIARQQQVVLSTQQIAQGRREFDVWPDCGKHPFPYVVNLETASATITVTTPYYRDPMLSWTINGVAVAPGDDRTMFVPADTERPVDAPARPGLDPPPDEGSGVKVKPRRMVALRTSLDGQQLKVVNDPEDGNYTLAVQVRAQDGADVTSITSRTTAIDFVGLREVVDGLGDASAECWKKYLNAHRSGAQPTIKAIIETIYAQLRRPADPLWDPDPSMIDLGLKVAKDDPTVAAVAQWRIEFPPEAAAFNPATAGALITGGEVSITGVAGHPTDVSAASIHDQLFTIDRANMG